MVKRDLSELPPATRAEGEPPHPEALRYLSPIADAWYRDYMARGEDDRAFAVEGSMFRASWAGKCARDLSYRYIERKAKLSIAREDRFPATDIQAEDIIGALNTNPPTVADLYRMNIGTMIHNEFQRYFAAAFPQAQIECAVELDIDGSATVDMLLDETETFTSHLYDAQAGPIAHETTVRTLIELKSAAGYKFKKATQNFRGAAEGPSWNHRLQAAMAGKACGADRIVIGYLSLEATSKQQAVANHLGDLERIMGGWIYERDLFVPWAETEERRVTRVLELVNEGTLAPRAIPDPELPKGAVIVRPGGGKNGNGVWNVFKDGAIAMAGETWWCAYCDNVDRCKIDDDPGMMPIPVELGGRRA